jgi:hypothetical protein
MWFLAAGAAGSNVPPMAPLRKRSARPAGGLRFRRITPASGRIRGIDSGIENACPIWAGPRRYIDTV